MTRVLVSADWLIWAPSQMCSVSRRLGKKIQEIVVFARVSPLSWIAV